MNDELAKQIIDEAYDHLETKPYHRIPALETWLKKQAETDVKELALSFLQHRGAKIRQAANVWWNTPYTPEYFYLLDKDDSGATGDIDEWMEEYKSRNEE